MFLIAEDDLLDIHLCNTAAAWASTISYSATLTVVNLNWVKI